MDCFESPDIESPTVEERDRALLDLLEALSAPSGIDPNLSAHLAERLRAILDGPEPAPGGSTSDLREGRPSASRRPEAPDSQQVRGR